MTPTTRDDDTPVGHDCPLCGRPAAMRLDNMDFCGTDGCLALSWDPRRTWAELAANVAEVRPLP